MNPVAQPIKLTYEDYLGFPEDGRRHELLDGEHVVTPSPFFRHQDVLMNLIRQLDAVVTRAGLGKLVPAPFDVVLSETDVVEPDLCFIEKENLPRLETGHLVGPPDLVVEILSESTRKRDEVTKRSLYEKFGVGEYWIVDPELDTVKVYRRSGPGYGRAIVHEQGASFETPLFPGLVVSLAQLFRR